MWSLTNRKFCNLLNIVIVSLSILIAAEAAISNRGKYSHIQPSLLYINKRAQRVIKTSQKNDALLSSSEIIIRHIK